MALKKLWKNMFGRGDDDSGHAEVARARGRAEEAQASFSSLARDLGVAPPALVAGQKALDAVGRDERLPDTDPARLVAAYDEAWKGLLQGRIELLHAHPDRMARDYIAMMGESAQDIEAPTARTFAFVHLAAFHHRHEDAEGEAHFLGRAFAGVGNGDQLSAVTGALLSVRSLEHGVDDAWLIARCQELRECVAAWGDPIEEVAAGNELIRGRAALGDLDGALAWAQEVEDPWYREQALASVLEALALAGDLARAQELLAELSEPPLVGAARKNLVTCIARAGDREAAREAARAIEDPEWRDAALREVVEFQARAGEVSEAHALLEEIENERWRADAQRGIAEARALEGDVTGALEAVAGLEDAAVQLGGLVEVARTLVERGDIAAAQRIVEGVKHSGTRALVFGAIACHFARHGQEREAGEALDHALEAASNAGPDVAHDALVGAIAEVRAHAGAAEQAIEAAEEVEHPNARAFVFHRIANGLVATKSLAQLAGLEAHCCEPLARTWFLLGAVTALGAPDEP